MVKLVTSSHSSEHADHVSTIPMDHATLLDEMKNNDKLPIEERVRLARQHRELQLQRYSAWVCDDPHSSAEGRPTPRGVKLSFPEDVHLLDAAAKGSLVDMEELLKRGVDPNRSNHEGLTALHQCCIDGHADMARLLLQYGASVNAVDRDGWTPLHAAATCGHLAIVRMLVDKGADLLAVNGDGDMPFDITEDDATLIYVEEAMTNKGITPDMVHEKRDELHNKILSDVKDLIESGESLDGPVNEDGATLLHVAVVNEFNDVAKLLLNHGASDTTEDAEGWRPIHAAAFWGNTEAIELLVKTRDTDLRAATHLGLEPLDISEDIIVRGKILELMNANERYSNKAEEEVGRESRSRSHVESVDNVDSSDSPFLQLISPDTEADNNLSAQVEHKMESIFDDEGEGGMTDDDGVEAVVLLPTLQRVESLGSRRNSVREAKKQAPMISQSHSKLDAVDSYDYSYDLMLTKKKTEIHKITTSELTNFVMKEEEKNGVKEETQKVVYVKQETTVKENNQTSVAADVNSNEYVVVDDGSDDDSSKGAVKTPLRRDSSSSSSTSTHKVRHRQGQASHENSHQSDSVNEDQIPHQLTMSRLNNNAQGNIYEESEQTLPSYENPREVHTKIDFTGTFSTDPPTPPATAPRTVFSDISYIQVGKHVDKPKTTPAYDNNDNAQVEKHATISKTAPAYDNNDNAQVEKHATISKIAAEYDNDYVQVDKHAAYDNSTRNDILTEVSIREVSRGRRETQHENDNVYENDLNQDDHVYESSTLPRGELEQVMIRPRPTSKSKPMPESTEPSGPRNDMLTNITGKSDRDSEVNASLRVPSSAAAADTGNEAAGEDIYTEIQLPGNQVPKRRTKKLEIPQDKNKSHSTLVKPKRGSLQELKMKRLSLRQSMVLDINSAYEPLDASATTSRPTVRPYSSVDAMAASNMYSKGKSSGDGSNAATAFKPPDSPTMIRHVFKQPVIVKERSIVTMKKRCSIM